MDPRSSPSRILTAAVGNPCPPGSRGRKLLASSIHEAVIIKDKDTVEHLLRDNGVDVEAMDHDGNTPLFIAAARKSFGIVKILLKYGANPNSRCVDGQTAVHGACIGGSQRILRFILSVGGSLWLHDNSGKLPQDWCELLSDMSDRRKMRRVIDNYEFHDLRSCSETVRNSSIQLAEMSSKCVPPPPDFNVGPGLNVFCGGANLFSLQNWGVEPAALTLSNPGDGKSYQVGYFSEMVFMTWQSSSVMVRRLVPCPPELSHPQKDILLSELDVLRRLRHPDLLLLMGVAIDEENRGTPIMTVLERAPYLSVYDYLHVNGNVFERHHAMELIQQIVRAVAYLHSRGWLHCALTSHAVHLLAPNRGKLSCLEYAVSGTMPESEKLWKMSELIYHAAFHRWLAPEVVRRRMACSEASDVYSLCVLMAEIMTGSFPWSSVKKDRDVAGALKDPPEVKLPRVGPSCPASLVDALKIGLRFDRKLRTLKVLEIAELIYFGNEVMIPVTDGDFDNLRGSSPSDASSLSSSDEKEAPPYVIHSKASRNRVDAAVEPRRHGKHWYSGSSQKRADLKKNVSFSECTKGADESDAIPSYGSPREKTSRQSSNSELYYSTRSGFEEGNRFSLKALDQTGDDSLSDDEYEERTPVKTPHGRASASMTRSPCEKSSPSAVIRQELDVGKSHAKLRLVFSPNARVPDNSYDKVKPASHFSTRHGKSCSLNEPHLIGGPTSTRPSFNFDRPDPSRPGSVTPLNRSVVEMGSPPVRPPRSKKKATDTVNHSSEFKGPYRNLPADIIKVVLPNDSLSSAGYFTANETQAEDPDEILEMRPPGPLVSCSVQTTNGGGFTAAERIASKLHTKEGIKPDVEYIDGRFIVRRKGVITREGRVPQPATSEESIAPASQIHEVRALVHNNGDDSVNDVDDDELDSSYLDTSGRGTGKRVMFVTADSGSSEEALSENIQNGERGGAFYPERRRKRSVCSVCSSECDAMGCEHFQQNGQHANDEWFGGKGSVQALVNYYEDSQELQDGKQEPVEDQSNMSIMTEFNPARALSSSTPMHSKASTSSSSSNSKVSPSSPKASSGSKKVIARMRNPRTKFRDEFCGALYFAEDEIAGGADGNPSFVNDDISGEQAPFFSAEQSFNASAPKSEPEPDFVADETSADSLISSSASSGGRAESKAAEQAPVAAVKSTVDTETVDSGVTSSMECFPASTAGNGAIQAKIEETVPPGSGEPVKGHVDPVPDPKPDNQAEGPAAPEQPQSKFKKNKGGKNPNSKNKNYYSDSSPDRQKPGGKEVKKLEMKKEQHVVAVVEESVKPFEAIEEEVSTTGDGKKSPKKKPKWKPKSGGAKSGGSDDADETWNSHKKQGFFKNPKKSKGKDKALPAVDEDGGRNSAEDPMNESSLLTEDGPKNEAEITSADVGNSDPTADEELWTTVINNFEGQAEEAKNGSKEAQQEQQAPDQDGEGHTGLVHAELCFANGTGDGKGGQESGNDQEKDCPSGGDDNDSGIRTTPVSDHVEDGDKNGFGSVNDGEPQLDDNFQKKCGMGEVEQDSEALVPYVTVDEGDVKPADEDKKAGE